MKTKRSTRRLAKNRRAHKKRQQRAQGSYSGTSKSKESGTPAPEGAFLYGEGSISGFRGQGEIRPSETPGGPFKRTMEHFYDRIRSEGAGKVALEQVDLLRLLQSLSVENTSLLKQLFLGAAFSKVSWASMGRGIQSKNDANVQTKTVCEALGLPVQDNRYAPTMTPWLFNIYDGEFEMFKTFREDDRAVIVDKVYSLIKERLAVIGQEGSYATLARVGMNEQASLLAIVFYSRMYCTAEDVEGIFYNGIFVPILFDRDTLAESVFSGGGHESWEQLPICYKDRPDVSGMSIGRINDIKEAGTFTGWVKAKGSGKHYGITCQHNVKDPVKGDRLAMPSCLEATSRLSFLHARCDYHPNPAQLGSTKKSMAKKEFDHVIECYGEISGLTQEDPRAILLVGGKIVGIGGVYIGTVEFFAAEYRPLLTEHNSLLTKAKKKAFPHHRGKEDSDVLATPEAVLVTTSRLEWLLFEAPLDRIGRNIFNIDFQFHEEVPRAIVGTALIESGMKVMKQGRTSGLRYGTVHSFFVFILGDGPTQTVSCEIGVRGLKQTTPFAEAGDSGSAVVVELDNMYYCTGVVWARGQFFACVTPIQAILNHIGEQRGGVWEFCSPE